MTEPATLSLIVTCKGRLAHLQRSLPLLAAQPGCEVVVVDYDCPDGTAAWVKEHVPSAGVVEVRNAATFNHSHARNLGAQAASSAWLSFVDADTLVAPAYSAGVIPLLADGCFFRPAPMPTDAWGNVVCRKADFVAVSGYDDVMRGWGGEDDDLYVRLTLAGCRLRAFPGALIGTIAHASAERVRYLEIKDRWLNHRAHALYLHIKFDLLRQAGKLELPRDLRAEIYEEVRRTVLADAARGSTTTRVTVNLPVELMIPMWGWTIRRQWIFDLEQIPGVPPPQP
ncbi:MAG: glycosyltransferase [Rhodocyclales bacterium]|nr:glycosyltransferase [Rhodocyclales bacterium]